MSLVSTLVGAALLAGLSVVVIRVLSVLNQRWADVDRRTQLEDLRQEIRLLLDCAMTRAAAGAAPPGTPARILGRTATLVDVPFQTRGTIRVRATTTPTPGHFKLEYDAGKEDWRALLPVPLACR